MKKIFTTLLLLFIFMGAMAQTTTIKGKVIFGDDRNIAAIGVIVSLHSLEEGQTPIAVSSDNRGNYSITVPTSEKIVLAFNYFGYKEQKQTIKPEEGQTTITLDNVILRIDAFAVESVEVVGNASMSIVKDDTIQFNAAAFKTHPDATAQDLLKKMPGITVDDDGNLESAGETISKVYVNGKEFFMDDPSMALKSLPVDAVESVQLYDDQSDEAKFSGFDDGERIKTINIVTKHGVMDSRSGKISAGYGTEGRYSAGAQLNGYGDVHNFAIIASANNANIRDFSPRDILSGSGGGSSRRGNSSSNAADLSGFSQSTNGGITESYMIGGNYSGTYEKVQLNLTYFYMGQNADISQNTEQNYLYMVRNYISRDTSMAYSNTHMFRSRLEWNPGERNRINFNTSLYYSNNFGDKISLAGTTTDESYTGSDSYYRSMLERMSGSADLWWQTRLSDHGRTLSIGAMVSGNRDMGNRDQLSYTTTDDFISTQAIDTMDLYALVNSSGYSLTGSATYSEPIGERSRLMANYSLNYNKTFSDNDGFTYDQALQDYSLVDTSTTNFINRNYTTHMAGIGYNYALAKKLTLTANVTYQYATLNNEQTTPLYDNITQFDDYSFDAVLPSLTLNYIPKQGQNLNFTYTANSVFPSVSQLQDVMDVTNPLQVSSGNPDLEQSYSHTARLRYNLALPAKNINFNVFASANATSNYIATHSKFLDSDTTVFGTTIVSGAQYSTPVNLQGYYNASLHSTFSFGINPIKSNMSVTAFYRYSHTPSIEDDIEYVSNGNRIGGRLSLTSNISQWVDFTLSYSPMVNLTSGANSSFDRYLSHTASAYATVYFFKYFFINADASWVNTYGTQESYGQHYAMINGALGAKLFNSSTEIKLSVSDALNQNQSIWQTTADTYTQLVQSSVLGRYYMVSLSYKFDTRKSGRKTDGEDERRGEGPGGYGGPGGGPGGGGPR